MEFFLPGLFPYIATCHHILYLSATLKTVIHFCYMEHRLFLHKVLNDLNRSHQYVFSRSLSCNPSKIRTLSYADLFLVAYSFGSIPSVEMQAPNTKECLLFLVVLVFVLVFVISFHWNFNFLTRFSAKGVNEFSCICPSIGRSVCKSNSSGLFFSLFSDLCMKLGFNKLTKATGLIFLGKKWFYQKWGKRGIFGSKIHISELFSKFTQ